MSEEFSAKNLKDKNIVKTYIVGCLDHLVALIDNGGRRFWVERRQNYRRINIDRRKSQNQKRINGSERRAIHKNDG
jgi:hypothetical protein